MIPFVYQNGYNVSQFGSCNGTVTINVNGGVTPYTYFWEPGHQTIGNPVNLCAADNQVVITDANGCNEVTGFGLNEPERDDWTMSGNYSSNPATHFIGTRDSVKLLFKTNSQERVSIAADGQFRINRLGGTGSRSLLVDSLGKLIAAPSLSWMTNGNFLSGNEFIGSANSKDLVFKTSGLTRMKIKSNGKISISEFENTANGILYTDYLGEIWKLDFDPLHPDLFLDATGSFSALPTGSNAWSLSGQTVYNMHSGKTGIGTTNPAYKLHVVQDPLTGSGGIIVESNSGSNANSEIQFRYNGNPKWSIGSNVQHTSTDHNFFIYDNTVGNVGETRFYIDEAGRTGIGVIPPTSWPFGSAQYRLYVEGGIMTRDVKVTTQSPFPDYVFDKDYDLMSIPEYGNYFIEHKHLPGIPTAAEIEEQKGFEVGAMQVKLLEKVEEQARYIVDLQRQLDELKAMLTSKK